jgi:hypothetical protein
MLVVYHEAVCDEDYEDDSETYTTEASESEPQTVEEHVWAVVTTEDATPTDLIKNSALFQAVRDNGYCQSHAKFVRDVQFLRSHPKVGVVRVGNNVVYSGLRWL